MVNIVVRGRPRRANKNSLVKSRLRGRVGIRLHSRWDFTIDTSNLYAGNDHQHPVALHTTPSDDPR